MTDLTRRKLLGVAAGTLPGAVGLAQPAVADDTSDLELFVRVSAALTGIDEGKLAPGVDPIPIKLAYFDQAKSDPGFNGLMQIVRADPSNPPVTAAEKIMNNTDPNIQYLGRSVILAWYLGSWYPRQTLQQTQPSEPASPQKIISPAAYTQAWAYRVAQAHPMGYSELRFGYWSDEPLPLGAFIQAGKP